MYTKLNLSGWRRWKDEIEVEFKPLTFIVGEQGAGKTSILESMAITKNLKGLEQSRVSAFDQMHGIIHRGGNERVRIEDSNGNVIRYYAGHGELIHIKEFSREVVNQYHAFGHSHSLMTIKHANKKTNHPYWFGNDPPQDLRLSNIPLTTNSQRAINLVDVMWNADIGSTLLIENPERGLSRSMQYELADMFIRAMQERSLQLIVETTSPELMLRMQRRIAEEELDFQDTAWYACFYGKES